MRNKAKRAAPVTADVRERARRCADAVWTAAFGLGAVLAMPNAMAAGPATLDGVVRFTGALVDRYDVTLDAPSVARRDAPEGAGSNATATLRFDAHGRRLPGAQVTLVGADGVPFAPDAGAGMQATWRDARDGRSVPLASGRAHRVGPHGGVMTVAADEATGAVAPVVINIRHP
ncbi:thioesterase [Burkholderia arboris]|uniref:thioesterase n=1 Tax=Burkholderia arboris TaxID=488730 RepID=UPI002108ED26|nr:thioesterase [Burkholderia arboris]UTV58146.1 thioesterase [Burkholderia arboris]